MIKLLLSAGADKTLKNKHGSSPEALARKIGNYDVAGFLKVSPIAASAGADRRELVGVAVIEGIGIDRKQRRNPVERVDRHRPW